MHTPYITPALVLGEDLRTHLLAHATPQPGEPYLYTVHTPLHVFKKARADQGWGEVLINLVIPVGEFLFASEKAWISDNWTISYRKMRASKAKVHSIINLDTRKEVVTAKSDYSTWFKYRKGKTVTPNHFSKQNQFCAGGIHFFLNVGDALNYQF